jgi:hypothetical protein
MRLTVADTGTRTTLVPSDLGPHEHAAPVKGAVGIVVSEVLPTLSETAATDADLVSAPERHRQLNIRQSSP